MDPPRVCAWCDRVLVDGAWRRSPVPATQLENVTHGICPECRDRAEAALDGAQA